MHQVRAVLACVLQSPLTHAHSGLVLVKFLSKHPAQATGHRMHGNSKMTASTAGSIPSKTESNKAEVPGLDKHLSCLSAQSHPLPEVELGSITPQTGQAIIPSLVIFFSVLPVQQGVCLSHLAEDETKTNSLWQNQWQLCPQGHWFC